MKAKSIFPYSAFFLVLFLAFFSGMHESEAQVKHRRRSSKEKRISNYKGGAINFKRDRRYLSAGISINTSNYLGDLTPTASPTSVDFSSTRISGGATATYRYWSNSSFAASLNWHRIYGDDFYADVNDETSGYYRYQRNLHFRNDIIEVSVSGILDLLHNRGTYFVRPPLVPYIFGGMAIFYHNPKAIAPPTDLNGNPLPEGGKWVALRPLGTEGQNNSSYSAKKYSPVQISIPFGIGIRYKWTNYLDIELEAGYRFLFTDYIDDVSKYYVDPGALDSELAKAMSFRSLEPLAASTGKERILSNDLYSFVSRFDGKTYNVLKGYGHDNIKCDRGNAKDNDHYIVSSIKLKYILHGKSRKINFR